MPKQSGRNLRVKKGDGGSPETFSVIAGAREDSFTCERGEVDITDKDDATTRALMEGGIEAVSLTVSGLAVGRTLLQDFLAGLHINYQVEWVDVGDTLEGTFEIASYEEVGNYENNAVEFTMQLRSAGAVTLTTA